MLRKKKEKRKRKKGRSKYESPEELKDQPLFRSVCDSK